MTSLLPYFTTPEKAVIIGVAATLLGFLLKFVQFIYRTIRNYEITEKFVYDIGTNHLPHIYAALTQIQLAHRCELELKDPPPIQFVDLTHSPQ